MVCSLQGQARCCTQLLRISSCCSHAMAVPWQGSCPGKDALLKCRSPRSRTPCAVFNTKLQHEPLLVQVRVDHMLQLPRRLPVLYLLELHRCRCVPVVGCYIDPSVPALSMLFIKRM